jgi:Domain of unknown function (DUF4145)
MSQAKGKMKKIRCNMCNGLTNHTLRQRYSWTRSLYDGPDESGNIVGTCEHRYSIWTCAGCDAVIFEEQMAYDDGETYEEYYPMHEPRRKTFKKLSPELQELYTEVVACFNRGSFLLFTIGLRALIERICAEKGLNAGNLQQKIEGLFKFVPNMNVIEALHSCRAAGNEAAHELKAMSADEAEQALEIIEDILGFLYDLDYKASQVKSARRIAPSSGPPSSIQ